MFEEFFKKIKKILRKKDVLAAKKFKDISKPHSSRKKMSKKTRSKKA